MFKSKSLSIMKLTMCVLAVGSVSAEAAPGGRPVQVVVTQNNGKGGTVVRNGRPVVVRPQPAPSRPGRPVVIRPGPSSPGNSGATPRLPVTIKPSGRYGRDNRIVIKNPSSDEIDQIVAQVFISRAEDLSCGELGEFLRRISNDVLSASQLPDVMSDAERRVHPGNRDQFLKVQRERALKNMLKRPLFAKTLMSRLSEMFRGCNLNCFDDGVAIGVISGTGFCHAAVGVGGLPDLGFSYQDRLPVCETGNFVGCQQGYAQAVNSVQGCLSYATGPFQQSYNHQVSQDCHIDY